ncbi:Transcription factor spt8 [Blastocladiella emersonii ATCC 22665]|nr:Transcription factor spt8 [Blastocladiella emersonii ATCC 22665]
MTRDTAATMDIDSPPCAGYDITPIASIMTSSPIYAVAATRCWRWVFTGACDGRIAKWDWFATVNGKTMLTQVQRSGMVDTVVKGGHLLSYWYCEDGPETQDHWVAHREAARAAPLLARPGSAPTTKPVAPPQLLPANHGLPPPGVADTSPVYALAAQAEAQWVVAGTRRGGVNLYSARYDEGALVAALVGHTDAVSALRLSGDETRLLSGSWDSNLIYWDLNTGAPVFKLTSHVSQISSISAHPRDPNLYLSTAINGTAYQWDVRSPTRPASAFHLPEKTPPWTLSGCYNPRSAHVYLGRRNNSVDEYAPDGTLVGTLALPRNSGPASRVMCLPNGRSLLIGSYDNLRVWDLQHSGKGVPFTIAPGHHGSNVAELLIDPSSRFLMSASSSRGWDTAAQRDSTLCFAYRLDEI